MLPCRFWQRGEEEGNSSDRTSFARFPGHTSHLSHTAALSQAALVTDAPGEFFAIEPFEKWNHDSPRTLKLLSQSAYRGRSIFGNEISDHIFHAFKALARQHNVRRDFNHFSAFYQKSENPPRFRVRFELSSRRWIERLPA